MMTIEKLDYLSKRDFLKYLSLFSISTAFPFLFNCSTLPRKLSHMGIDLPGINTDGFELYKGPNPNQKAGQQTDTFKQKMHKGSSSPGHVFYTYDSIYAMCSGKVSRIFKSQSSKSNIGGYNVEISDMLNTPFRILYGHVEDVQVEMLDEIKRGELIAKKPSDVRFRGGEGPPVFKIILNRYHNYEDPDNYGVNHSAMDYWDGNTNLDVSDAYLKSGKQRDIIGEFVNSYKGRQPNPFGNLAKMSLVEHRKPASEGASTYYWSAIERFRLLEYIHMNNQGIFDLTDSDFQKLKGRFYLNQPVILTLPFKR